MLALKLENNRIEVGLDEAGRGPLAGPVVAAAVVLPDGYEHPKLNDSKQVSARLRHLLRADIEQQALAWAVASVEASDIDRLNILHASTHAMNLAAKAIMGECSEGVIAGGGELGKICPDILLVDGNRFYNETSLPYQCIVKGDAKLMSIAAASILAKTYRDDRMAELHQQHPQYGWNHNQGYPTLAHYQAIEQYGITPYHRRSFTLFRQHSLFE